MTGERKDGLKVGEAMGELFANIWGSRSRSRGRRAESVGSRRRSPSRVVRRRTSPKVGRRSRMRSRSSLRMTSRMLPKRYPSTLSL